MTSTFYVRNALDEIASDTRPPSVHLADTALRRARRRRYATRGAMAAVAVAAAVPIAMSIWNGATPDTTAPPAGMPYLPAEVGATDPRHLLINDSVWEIIYADDLGSDSGEIKMTDGDRGFELRWWPVNNYEPTIDERRRYADVEKDVAVASHEAILFRDAEEINRTYNTVWQDTDLTLEFRGDGFSDQSDYETVLDAVVEVDEATWFAALPGDTVFADDRDEVVAEMLADIPTPESFDAGDIMAADETEGRYHVGADVTRAVLCAWTDQWVAATEAGDDASAEAAVVAITTAYDWAILVEIEDQGGWSDAMWDGVDVFANDLSVAEVAEIFGNKDQAANPNRGLEVYEEVFGCNQ